MLINLELVAREYNPILAEKYFHGSIYNGTINECKEYLKQRQDVARHNNDDKFIRLTGSMIFNGLVKYSKNSYTIAFISDDSGYIYNVPKNITNSLFTVYNNNTIGYDYPYNVPKYIQKYLEKIVKNR